MNSSPKKKIKTKVRMSNLIPFPLDFQSTKYFVIDKNWTWDICTVSVIFSLITIELYIRRNQNNLLIFMARGICTIVQINF